MSLPLNQIVCGDAFQVLPSFPEESIDMVLFSPPYWGLRDYKIPKVDDVFAVAGLGLENHPKAYVERMVVLCRLLRRVLKKEGSMFINLGDTYFGHWGGGPDKFEREAQDKEWNDESERMLTKPHHATKYDGKWLQPKQLLLIPSRVAIALQEDGWLLRNDICWHKPNHMPSSVKDRLTNSWEHLFHFVKNRRYFYDLDAIREPHKVESIERIRSAQTRITKPKDIRKIDANIGAIPQRSSIDGIVVELNPLGKAPDDVYQGKFEGFNEESEKYGSPRARNERQPIKIGMHHGSSLTSGRATHYEGQLIEENPIGKNPSDTILYDSKYQQEHGQTLQGFIREQSIAKRRLESREEAKRLFPNKLEKQQEYINYIHDHNMHELGKNPSDFWSITTHPFKEAHFAVYPEAICINPIKASCPMWICRKCGKPKTRITKTNYLVDRETPKGNEPKAQHSSRERGNQFATMQFAHGYGIHETVGWSSCNCNVGFDSGVVLDPMCGSGTTLVVARKLCRNYIGIELNASYVEIAKKRLAQIPQRLDVIT